MKRLVDILGAASGLVLLSPILAVVAVLIWRQMGAPVLFRQTRLGRNGKPFEMVKFRTMRDAVGAQGHPLPDSEKLTWRAEAFVSNFLAPLGPQLDAFEVCAHRYLAAAAFARGRGAFDQKMLAANLMDCHHAILATPRQRT